MEVPSDWNDLQFDLDALTPAIDKKALKMSITGFRIRISTAKESFSIIRRNCTQILLQNTIFLWSLKNLSPAGKPDSISLTRTLPGDLSTISSRKTEAMYF